MVKKKLHRYVTIGQKNKVHFKANVLIVVFIYLFFFY